MSKTVEELGRQILLKTMTLREERRSEPLPNLAFDRDHVAAVNASLKRNGFDGSRLFSNFDDTRSKIISVLNSHYLMIEDQWRFNASEESGEPWYEPFIHEKSGKLNLKLTQHDLD